MPKFLDCKVELGNQRYKFKDGDYCWNCYSWMKKRKDKERKSLMFDMSQACGKFLVCGRYVGEGKLYCWSCRPSYWLDPISKFFSY